ncbi:hypothetical protein ALC60_07013 [Trachymyrmex zeteki]|uniref:Antistasin-like domain-containing protein n=1 Tax=Mycetomoellerius zeteki TaxID=64791 RepID=A0A151X160_9HYME|nr:hypothetical protein ALC60_07013 [Trachymyrmex zeteki]
MTSQLDCSVAAAVPRGPRADRYKAAGKKYLKMRRNFYNGGLTCSSGLVLLTCLLLVLSLSTSIIAAPFVEQEVGAEIPDLTVSNNNVEHKCPILACRLKCVWEQEVDAAGCRICKCKNPMGRVN